jgi:hypothetical protein
MDVPVDPPLTRTPDWISSAGLDDMRVLTFAQWCEVNHISEATGNRILKSGNGPKVVQLSERRRGIRVGDNRKWQDANAR